MATREGLQRFFYQCTNKRCAATLAVEGFRPREVMCALCCATTRPVFGIVLADETPRLNMGNGMAVIGGAIGNLPRGGPPVPSSPAGFNKAHSAWLAIVHKVTVRWLMAEIAYKGTSWMAGTEEEEPGTIHAIFDADAAAEVFEEVNAERTAHGLRPLTWDDVKDEAENL